VAGEIRDLFWGLCRKEVRVGLVAWGYDREKFYPDRDPAFRRKLGVPPGAFLVLAVSTQDPRKRFADIETAIRLLSRRRPVHGVFIGQGPAWRQKNIHYLGHVPDEVLRRAYSSCDVFVNWSAAEGFGLPVIEALACGARVIVPPDNPTLQEVGSSQVLVAERATPEGLMQALASAARDQSRPQGRADLRQFDWDVCCRRVEEELWSTPVRLRLAA
jgi:glycosyltransferase involved in cell wall biosynthesis